MVVHADAVPGRTRSSILTWHYVAGLAVITVGCWIASEAGSALLFTGTVGAFWPATGVAIAVLYFGGLRWWPAVMLGDFLGNTVGILSVPLAEKLPEAFGNTASAVLSTVILLRLIGRRAAMDRLEHVVAVFLAVAAGEAIGATVATVVSQVHGDIGTSEVVAFWRSWWLGGVSGALVVVPLALAWANTIPRPWREIRLVESALVLAAVAGLSVLALSAAQPLTYVVFPGFIWAALRLGPPIATISVAVASGIAVWMTANTLGAFVTHSPNDSALGIQLYITIAALTTLCLAAIVREQRQAALEVASSRSRIVAEGARERHRIETELHDSAQNRLIALMMRLGLARDAAQQTSPDLVPALDVIIGDAEAATEDLRRIAHGILPPVLSTQGLAAALRSEGAHSAISVSVSGAVGRSEQDIELAVYLCCLEAIQNAARHAGPDVSVTVTLLQNAGDLMFRVDDTGAGFDSNATKKGAGLTNVRDRVEGVGGHVDVSSATGRGTTVTGVVPWPGRSS